MNARLCFLRRLKGAFHIITLAAALALLLTPVASTSAEAAYNPELIRLHVLANSDGEADQALKLLVRDAIRGLAAEICEDARSADEAYALLEKAKDELEATANAELFRQNSTLRARVQLGVFPFPDKEYAGVTVPSGDYRAVRVMIGEAVGQNWWCVLYPDLCFVEEECAEAALTYDITFYSSIARFFARYFDWGNE